MRNLTWPDSFGLQAFWDPLPRQLVGLVPLCANCRTHSGHKCTHHQSDSCLKTRSEGWPSPLWNAYTRIKISGTYYDDLKVQHTHVPSTSCSHLASRSCSHRVSRSKLDIHTADYRTVSLSIKGCIHCRCVPATQKAAFLLGDLPVAIILTETAKPPFLKTQVTTALPASIYICLNIHTRTSTHKTHSIVDVLWIRLQEPKLIYLSGWFPQ